jgi:hypothetical protein
VRRIAGVELWEEGAVEFVPSREGEREEGEVEAEEQDVEEPEAEGSKGRKGKKRSAATEGGSPTKKKGKKRK